MDSIIRWKNEINAQTEAIVSQSPTETWPVLAGISSFGSILAVSTWTQLKVLGVSTGTRPPFIPSSLGVVSVCLASLASHQASMAAHASMEDFKRKRRIHSESILTLLDDKTRRRYCSMDVHHARSSISGTTFMSSGNNDSYYYDGANGSRSSNKEHLDVAGIVQIPMHTIRICVVGMIAFQLLGGRFWRVSPSSYTSFGSFAWRGIPATERYATASQRATIEKLGRFFGCHTCGSHRLFSSPPPQVKFVGDHMPPISVGKQINARWYNRFLNRQVKFRFYPQCTVCSNRQGSLLSAAVQQQSKRNLAKAGGGKLAHFHGFRPRINHIAGGVVAGVTVVGASDAEIQKGNPRRFRAFQTYAEDRLRRVLADLH